MAKKFTRRALDNYRKIIVSELKRELKKPGSDLEKSIVGRKITNRDGFKISMNYYGFYVDKGFGPGKWPGKPYTTAVDNIQSWMEKKGIKPRSIANAKTPTLRQSAFLIARSIANKGIKPVNFFDVINKIEPKMTKEIKDAYLKDLNIELDKKIPKKNK